MVFSDFPCSWAAKTPATACLIYPGHQVPLCTLRKQITVQGRGLGVSLLEGGSSSESKPSCSPGLHAVCFICRPPAEQGPDLPLGPGQQMAVKTAPGRAFHKTPRQPCPGPGGAHGPAPAPDLKRTRCNLICFLSGLQPLCAKFNCSSCAVCVHSAVRESGAGRPGAEGASGHPGGFFLSSFFFFPLACFSHCLQG